MTDTETVRLPNNVDGLRRRLTEDMETLRKIELRYRESVDEQILMEDEMHHGGLSSRDAYATLGGLDSYVDSVGSELGQAVEAMARVLAKLNKARSLRRH